MIKGGSAGSGRAVGAVGLRPWVSRFAVFAVGLSVGSWVQVAGAGVVYAAAPVTSFLDLQTAFAAGGHIALGADISSNMGLAVGTGKSVTLDLAGHHLSVTGLLIHAGITVEMGEALTIDDSGGGTLLATGGYDGSGIGGNGDEFGGGTAGTVTVNGGSVTAMGGAGGAGIGGGRVGGSGGAVTVNGGSVIATGGIYGAGIGGGDIGRLSGTLTVNGGSVTASGGEYAAGIGGGESGPGGSVMVNGGTVSATGLNGGAGIGGGSSGGSGGSVVIGPDGQVTASGSSDASAVGPGSSGASFGSLSNAGTLTVPQSARLAIPVGVSVSNSGTLSLAGALAGAGTVTNTGTISVTGTGSVADNGDGQAGHLAVRVHNYTVGFDVNGAPGTAPGDQHVYAASLTAAGLSLPAGPARPNTTFAGWFTAGPGGTQVTGTTDLSTVAATGPSNLTLSAQDAVQLAFDSGGGGLIPTQTVPYGGGGDRPATDPTRSGAIFDEWYTAKTGGEKFFDFPRQLTADTTIYARYGEPLTFTSTPPADAEVGGTYQLGATSGPNVRPVAFTTASSDCTISGATVMFTHPGVCTVDAAQAAIDYLDPSEASQTLLVGPGGQHITFTTSPPAHPAVGGSYRMVATGGASGQPVVFATSSAACTVTGSTVAFVHVGSCLVTAGQAGTADYTAAPNGTQNLIIGQAAQSITVTSTPPAHPAVGGGYPLSATGGSSGQPLTFALDPASGAGVCTIGPVAVVTFTGLGRCVLDISQGGDPDHQAAPTVKVTVTVDTVPPTLAQGGVLPVGTVGTAYSVTVADTGAPAPTDTVSAGALPPGLTLAGDPVISGVPTTAGIYTFTITAINRGGDSNATYSLTINPAPVPPPPPPAPPNSPPPLAYTGAELPVQPAITTALIALLAGLALTIAGRRRRHH